MNLGLPEMLLIAGVALLFFGPSKLPGLGKSIGEAIRGFKKGLESSPEEEKKERLAENHRQPHEPDLNQKSKQAETEKKNL